MLAAKEGNVVKVQYTGRLADGSVFDSSEESRPLQFIVGKNEVVKGFEQAVVGMVSGEKRTVTVPSSEAYGPVKPEQIEEIDLSVLPEDMEVELGSKLEVTRPDGSIFYVAVVGLTEDTVTLDANHPLAGKDLTFDIEMLEVTQVPTQPPTQH